MEYKPLGNFIQKVNERNNDLSITKLQGINIDKFFMSSVANIVGTDLSKYRIVRKGQFACNRMHVGRDERLPISLLTCEDPIIVSPAYDVFEIIDETILDKEYLMLCFRREEFDRNCWFYTDADVRGGLRWEDFCKIEIPIPSLAEQKEKVAKFCFIEETISNNEKTIKELERLFVHLYKLWFIDKSFPKQEGRHVRNEQAPNWKVSSLESLVDTTLGGDWGKAEEEGNYKTKVYCVRGADIPNVRNAMMYGIPERFILSKNAANKVIKANQIIIEISGGSPTQSTGRNVIVTEDLLQYFKVPLICSNFCQTITLKEEKYAYLVFAHLNYLYEMDVLFNYENGTTGIKNLDLQDVLNEQVVVIPDNDTLHRFNQLYEAANRIKLSLGKEISVLRKKKDELISMLIL